jgi:hypothetical protein
MAVAIYMQSIIAVIWDFDRTLIPGYCQKPLFDEYEIDEAKFWAEVNAIEGRYRERGIRVGADTAYLGHLLSYVSAGKLPGLTNPKFLELGARIECCPGIPELFPELDSMVADVGRYVENEIHIEHYVVSTGIRQLIAGSPVGPYLKDVWANEFIDQPLPPGFLDTGHTFGEHAEIAQVGYMMDNTAKTRAIFEINKGKDIDVNARVPEEDRRIPMKNMIYVADGPSDVPVYSLLMKNGGRNLGVYQAGAPSNFDGVSQLADEGRVHSTAEADFTEGSHAYLWLNRTIRQMADEICIVRERRRGSFKAPASHVIE